MPLAEFNNLRLAVITHEFPTEAESDKGHAFLVIS